MLFLVNTVSSEDGSRNTFLCTARDEDEARIFFEDDITGIVDIFTGKDVENYITREYDGLALLNTI